MRDNPEGHTPIRTRPLNKKSERTLRGALPEGPYLFDVIRHEAHVDDDGKIIAFQFLLKLVGTDGHIHWFVRDTKKARWAWTDISDEFADLDCMEGCRYLVWVKREGFPDTGYKNKIGAFMAEVLE